MTSQVLPLTRIAVLLIAAAVFCTLTGGHPVAASVQQAVSIDGQWRSNINLVYNIKQNGNQFTWTVVGLNQNGQGSVNGLSIQATWTAGRGTGSAVGKIVVDAHGRAYRIEWSNGVVCTRQLPPIEAAGQPAVTAPKDLKYEGQVIETKPQEQLQADPGAAGLPFVYDFRVVMKSGHHALLEVSYNYNPPSSPPVELGCLIYANGREVGGHSARIPIKPASQAKALLPIGMNSEVLIGTLLGHGNESEEIEFRLYEAGKNNFIKTSMPFKEVWGDDYAILLRSTYSPTQYNDYEVKFEFFYSVDTKRYVADYYFNQGYKPKALMVVEPLYQGKQIASANGTVTLDELASMPKPNERLGRVVSYNYRTKQTPPQCDGVRVSLVFQYMSQQVTFWRGQFPVKLEQK